MNDHMATPSLIKMSSPLLQVYPPVYRLGPVGKWLRDVLMFSILRGTPVLIKIQQCRTSLLNKLMMMVSFLGEEDFYTLLVPFILWICDSSMGRLLSILMAIGFCCSGFLKNALCLPRPPSPPIYPIEKCNDWALPSHHAILNVTVPWYMWLYIYIHFDWSSIALSIAFFAISLWSFSIMFSRLYLGVHSPADILVGGVIGCFVLVAWLRVDNWIASCMQCEQFIGFLMVPYVLVLMLHPDPQPTTIIFIETISMVSVAVGVCLGYYTSHLFGVNVEALLEMHSFKLFPTQKFFQCLLRYMIGLVLLLVFKVLFTKVVSIVIRSTLSLLGIPCVYQKRQSQVTSEVVHFSKKFIVLDEVSPLLQNIKIFIYFLA